jgi:hypothetical protein
MAGSCELVENPAQILYGFANVRVPLKQVFLPQTEVLCTYDFDQVSEVPLPADRILVFGCRPCDARAMAQLDTVFGPENKGYADPYFRKRRESAVVVALACASPCPTCFCAAMGGGPAGTEGADLLAHELASQGGAPLEATEKGRPCSRHTLLTSRPCPADLGRGKRRRCCGRAAVRGQRPGSCGSGLDDGRWGADRKLHRCAPHLPALPALFDIADNPGCTGGAPHLDSAGSTVRKHASGHNPRKNKKEQLRPSCWFSYAVENTGTGCVRRLRRCITGCPVNLDIRDHPASPRNQP